MNEPMTDDLFALVPETVDEQGVCQCAPTDEDRNKIFGVERKLQLGESLNASAGQLALTQAAELGDVARYVDTWRELNNLRR
ncbi:MAG: hypothetical protein ACTS9Y_00130 [Methylophilus sp.]|uniref:hypothetical protein n=1 Tax=Methylophilus sp. TaxID=29541 RepID=UPI003FA196D8